jgi:phage terminase Nu1 subunit (DNA packaging protein)
MKTLAIDDLAKLPAVNALGASRLLGISLVAFNKLAHDGMVAPINGRRNAYSIQSVIAGYLKSQADDGQLPASRMAPFLGLSPQRFGRLVDDGVFDRPTGNQGYDRDKTMRKYIDHLRKVKGGNDEGKNSTSYSAARTKVADEQAAHIALKNATLRGEFTRTALIEEVVDRHHAVIRDRILVLPSLASRLVGLSLAEIEALLRKRAFEVCDELSEPKTYGDWPGEGDAVGSLEAAGGEEFSAPE